MGPSQTNKGEILSKLLSYADAKNLRDPSGELTTILYPDLRAVFRRERMTIAEIDRAIPASTF